MKPAKAVLATVAALGVAAAALLLGGGGRDGILLTDGQAVSFGDGTAAVYLTIRNPGGPDRLVGASSPDVQTLEFVGGPDGAALAIPGGSAPSLAGDGVHLLLRGLIGADQDGRLIALALEFARAGTVRTRLTLTPGARGVTHQSHGVGAHHELSPGEPVPEIALQTARTADGWQATVRIANLTLREDLADGPHRAGTGHGHLYLNGLKLQRLYGERARIGTLPPGTYTLTATLNTNDHRTYTMGGEPITAAATIAQSE